MIKIKKSKRIRLIAWLSIVCAISMGCSSTEMLKQEQTTMEQPREETKIEVSATDKEQSSEIITDETIRDNAHNIFIGTIEQTEIKMKISREGNSLTAAYITRTDDENFFDGEMKNSTEFELNDNEGGYLKGTIHDGSFSGTGKISGKNVTITMQLTTFFPIGYDYEDYYSGLFNKNFPTSSIEVERFAQHIKDSVKDKEKFIKLFKYPLDIRINGEVISVESEEEMAYQYDTLIAESNFQEKIENMYTKYLFLNYGGVCVEDGILWFEKDVNGDYKIWSLNYW
jgi:hypothetical protein